MFKSDRFYITDGGMGTMLQKSGLKSGELPESFNLTHPDIVTAIHKKFVDAGSDIITANTFGANRKKLGSDEKVEEVIKSGIAAVKRSGAKYAALDIGPIGALLEP